MRNQLALGCAFSLTQVFRNFKYKKLKLTDKLAKNIGMARSYFMPFMFIECLKIVFKDIIENNVTVNIPMYFNNYTAQIYIKAYRGEEFKMLRQKGLFQDFDLLKSNFTGYRMVLEINAKNNQFRKIVPIYLSGPYKRRLAELVNSGKQYC